MVDLILPNSKWEFAKSTLNGLFRCISSIIRWGCYRQTILNRYLILNLQGAR